jgi:hypothetical protein
MKTPALERTSAAKAGWLIIVLTIGWLVFLLWPDPIVKPPLKPLAPVVTGLPSKLEKVGLPNNPDFEGLPEIFAVWADHAIWKDGRTRFAYWNPADREFSYELEAIKVEDGFRFRVMDDMVGDQTRGEILADDCPIRFYQPNPIFSDPPFGSPGRRVRPINEKHEPSKIDVQILPQKPEVQALPVTPPSQSGKDSPKG